MKYILLLFYFLVITYTAEAQQKSAPENQKVVSSHGLPVAQQDINAKPEKQEVLVSSSNASVTLTPQILQQPDVKMKREKSKIIKRDARGISSKPGNLNLVR